jgi:DNA polymerase III delta prime subunit
MGYQIISLIDLTKLISDEEISRKYVSYICGFPKTYEYRHSEIASIFELVNCLSLSDKDCDGFIYGYVVPQLNKEFDLLKITKRLCFNIEIKSQRVTEEKMFKQLQQNRHYLRLLGKEVFLFTYVASTNELFQLTDDNLLKKVSFELLNEALTNLEHTEIDLDLVFSPKNILVSPLNSPDKFLKGDYLLIENQENKKKQILDYIASKNEERFFGLTGGPGTGKTLLLYDIAQDICKTSSVLMIHCGILCDGHNYLNRTMPNIKIIPAKDLKFREIRNVDIIFVDESHRLYSSLLDKILRWVEKAKATCIFSYDVSQKLSNSENRMNTVPIIEEKCGENIAKLTNKIRTNKELLIFITCLRDLTKMNANYEFNCVRIIYEHNKKKAVELANNMSHKDYTYISFTPSFYFSKLDYQKSENNTHTVIGQEFENVVMIMDDNFYYENGKLKAKKHPNPNYIYEQLLYQGLTRVRSKLAIIITDSSLLNKVLQLMKN